MPGRLHHQQSDIDQYLLHIQWLVCTGSSNPALNGLHIYPDGL